MSVPTAHELLEHMRGAVSQSLIYVEGLDKDASN